MPYEGRGMLFPPSYYRDQFTPAEEAQMEAEQAAAEEGAIVKYAVVRVSRTIPGGLRIVGRPTHDEEQAKRLAASYRTPHDVLPLAEVYRRRSDALGFGKEQG